MAKQAKKSFVFNCEWQEVLMDYPPEVRLEVYDAVIEYAVSGKLSELKPLAKMAFSFIKKEIDFNNSRYEETVSKRSEAGRKGMSARYASKGSASNVTNATSDNKTNTCYQGITNLTNVTDNDNVYDNEYENENDISSPSNPPKGESEDLEAIARKQKELSDREAELAAKEQELMKLEAALRTQKQKELPAIDFVSDDFKGTFRTWLEYKRERKESYKSGKSLKAAYSKLLQLSNNDPMLAAAIVEQSMANNWAGLFELKNNGNRTDTNQSRRQSVSRLKDLSLAILGGAGPTDG